MSKPEAEIDISIALARDLLRAQYPDISQFPVSEAASSWDNVIFRPSEDMALRMPCRAEAMLVWRTSSAGFP